MNVKTGTGKRRLRRADAARMRLLEKRQALAAHLANTRTTTVTLRVPAGLNEWLDGYVHGAWPIKIRKQELLIEALQLLIARRGGPQEEALVTDLLEHRKADGSQSR